jgi:heme-degrading monooxygenase HmoA
MDEKVKFSTQMDSRAGPVILINRFNVEPDEVDQFLKQWAAGSAIMKRQPGFISAQLHRGIAGSCVFLIYAVWESTEHYKHAFNNPEFQSSIKGYPESTTGSPHFFKKVAVSGICVE